MTGSISEGDAILYMKVGTHADEDLASIIKRKRQEIQDAGFSLWGYGGNTCHPTTMVQPFADAAANAGKPIRLVMQRVNSRHFIQSQAKRYSADGVTWQPIPTGILVTGSRHALCLKSLEEADFDLRLPDTRVAHGPSKGRAGDKYIKGHVDKACLEVVAPTLEDATPIHISLIAELQAPYAVLLD